MNTYEKSLDVLNSLFGKDCTFALATSKNNIPSVRVIDTYFYEGVFYALTNARLQKVREIESNPNVALCNEFYRFTGESYNMGHPLDSSNSWLRDILTVVFKNWYFAHNDENDKDLCFIKIIPKEGFFHKDDIGYKVNFEEQTVKEFPFIL